MAQRRVGFRAKEQGRVSLADGSKHMRIEKRAVWWSIGFGNAAAAGVVVGIDENGDV